MRAGVRDRVLLCDDPRDCAQIGDYYDKCKVEAELTDEEAPR